jgi:hypothetical protein
MSTTLSVVEQLHSDVFSGRYGITDLLDCVLICIWSLQKPEI